MDSSKSCRFVIFLYSLVLLSLVAATSAQWSELAVPLVRPPPPPPAGRRTVTCTLRQFPSCFQVRARCPVGCPTSCFMDCTLCKPVCSEFSPSPWRVLYFVFQSPGQEMILLIFSLYTYVFMRVWDP